MSYLVLARKWRPQNFEQVVGQDHAVKTIRNAIASNRVAHAYLFSGPRGVGKTSLARILAKALNCEQGPTPNPCQECIHCLEITRGNSMDVLEIDGASNRGIDEVRELKENIRYLPSSSKYKIYIIDEVHMLTKEAFNALLKTLEEPPAHVVFVFATTEVHKVPATILSRCQRFDFRRVAERDILAHLQHIAREENIPAQEKALQALAREAEGSVRDALSLMDQVLSYSPENITLDTVREVLGSVDRDTILGLIEGLLRGDLALVVETVDRLHQAGHDLKQFYKNLMEEIRNLLRVQIQANPEATGILEAEQRPHLENVLSLASRQWLLSALNQLLSLEAELRYASFPRFVLELALFRLAHLKDFFSVEELLEGVEKKALQTAAFRRGEPGLSSPSPVDKERVPAHAPPAPDAAPSTLASFMEFLKQESVVLSSLLQQGEVAMKNQGRLEVRFPNGAPGAELLDVEQLRNLATAYFKRPVSVTVTRDGNTKPQDGVSGNKAGAEEAGQLRRKALEHPLVQKVTEILGARLAEVRPRRHYSDEKEAGNG